MTIPHRTKISSASIDFASTYEQSWLQRVFFDPAHQATLALAAGIVQQPVSVLGVGCGTGKLLRRAGASWPQAQLIGVDPAEGMIELAKRLTPNATFSTGMAEALPLRDTSVDLALTTKLVPPLAGPDSRHARDRTGAASWRLLYPGGCLLPRLGGARFV